MAKRQRKPPAAERRNGRLPLLLAAVVCVGALAVALWPRPTLELPYLTARSLVVIDADTGRVLYDKEGDDPRSPASLTKLMTIFLVLDALAEGILAPEDTVTVTPEEAFTPGSKYGISPGDVLTVEQLIAGTMLTSGCDCVQCLVRLMAGTEEAFVQRMNQKAQDLKLEGSRYVNATGIDAAGHYMTALDIAQLARALVTTYPQLLDLTGQPEAQVGALTFRNMHRLVGQDPRVLGLKTGTTQIGGYNLVTYVQEGDRAYLIVLLDSNNDITRFSETATVVDVLFGEGSHGA